MALFRVEAKFTLPEMEFKVIAPLNTTAEENRMLVPALIIMAPNGAVFPTVPVKVTEASEVIVRGRLRSESPLVVPWNKTSPWPVVIVLIPVPVAPKNALPVPATVPNVTFPFVVVIVIVPSGMLRSPLAVDASPLVKLIFPVPLLMVSARARESELIRSKVMAPDIVLIVVAPPKVSA